MKNNFRHLLVETAIASTILFSPFFQSCNPEDGPLPNPEPEPPVVIDPPGNGGEEPGAISDTIAVEIVYASDDDLTFGFSDVHDYPVPDMISGYGVPTINTSYMNFVQTQDGESSIAVADIKMKLSLPFPNHHINLDNSETSIKINAIGDNVLFLADKADHPDRQTSADDMEPNTAIKQVTLNEGDAQSFYFLTDSLAMSSGMALSDEQFESYVKLALNRYFKDNTDHITIRDKDGVERVTSDANDIDFVNDTSVEINGQFSISAIYATNSAYAGHKVHDLADGQQIRAKLGGEQEPTP